MGPFLVVNSPLLGLYIRVPTTSAGRRSGVNWILLKSALIQSDKVFTASVLANPGTPPAGHVRWPGAQRSDGRSDIFGRQ